MAPLLKTCDDYLVVACRDKLVVSKFSCPEDVQTVLLPTRPLDSKQQQQQREQQNPEKEKSEKDDKASQKAEDNTVLTFDLSKDGRNLAVCDGRKFLHVFRAEANGWTLVSSRSVSRRASVMCFSSSNNNSNSNNNNNIISILVADKTGDVFCFPLDCNNTAAAAGDGGDGGARDGENGDGDGGDGAGDDENGAGDGDGGGNGGGDDTEAESGGTEGKLVLGHLSMLLDLMLVDQDRLLVTADRDEKVRISRFPDGYNIEAYCLGHGAFVSTLAQDPDLKLIFTGSGDCTVRVWDFQGRALCQRPCLQDLPSSPPPSNTESPSDDVTRPAVLQLSYCPLCRLVCVAMYRCPDILCYRLQSEGESYELTFIGVIKCQGQVASLTLTRCVLWSVCRHEERGNLLLEARRVDVEGDELKTSSLDEASPEALVVKAINDQGDALEAPNLDAVPHLWKSPIDVYVENYMERKRQRMEGGGGKGKEGGGGVGREGASPQDKKARA